VKEIKALCISFDCFFFFREEIVIISFAYRGVIHGQKNSGFLKFSLVLFCNRTHDNFLMLVYFWYL